MINASLTVEKGAFLFFYCNYTNVNITNSIIVGDSVITGDMIGGIGYSYIGGDITMNNVIINGWVNA